MGSSATNRLEAAETALKAEREARERAERSLTEAQAMIGDLQTKLTHAVLATDESRQAAQKFEVALAAERDAREKVETALQQAIAARDTAEERIREMKLATRATKIAATKSSVRAAATASADVAAAKGSSKPRVRPKEPRPVRWWVKKKKP